MQSLRFNALTHLSNNPSVISVESSPKITAIFNENVFTLSTARQFLSDEAYKSLLASTRGGKKLTAAWATRSLMV